MTALPREDVQDYPRPPALQPVPQRIEVRFAGAVIAETDQALRVLETHHAPTYYLPPDSVTAELRLAQGQSFCEWKGRASYFDVVQGGQVAARAAWSYARPSTRFAALEGFIAIYASQMEACLVGGTRVVPQPGEFYGGWVTPNLVGRIKGAPGTLHW